MFIKLGSVLKVQHGYAFKSENYVEKSYYRLVTLGNFSENNTFKYNDAKATYYGVEFPKEFILEENDLILPLTEQVVGLFGNTALVPRTTGFKFALNQRVGKIICDESKVDKIYLHYLLATEIVKKQLEARASGTRQRNISPENIYDVIVDLPDINAQHKIGLILMSIEKQIEKNNVMIKKLQVLSHAIFNKYFSSEETKTSLTDFPYIEIIKPGIDKFNGSKHYIATAEVEGDKLNYNVPLIEYATRENRANMQPIKNSVWFAKMKNSIKHIYIAKNDDNLLKNYILSTGFCGIKCDEIAFEYIINYINLPYFENKKNILSHGATMEGINNDDLKSFQIHLPSKEKLESFHVKTKNIHCKISEINNITNQLRRLKEKLLPLLINGQLK